MADYRRLISYIYEYEGKEKGKNVGFAKLETRNGQCRLNVSVKKIYMGGNAIGVYLLGQEGRETFLGNLFVRGGNGEFRTSVDAGNVDGKGAGLETYYGLTVHDVKNPWRSYKTIWEDGALPDHTPASSAAAPATVSSAAAAPVTAGSAAQNVSERKNGSGGKTAAGDKAAMGNKMASSGGKTSAPEVSLESGTGNAAGRTGGGNRLGAYANLAAGIALGAGGALRAGTGAGSGMNEGGGRNAGGRPNMGEGRNAGTGMNADGSTNPGETSTAAGRMDCSAGRDGDAKNRNGTGETQSRRTFEAADVVGSNLMVPGGMNTASEVLPGMEAVAPGKIISRAVREIEEEIEREEQRKEAERQKEEQQRTEAERREREQGNLRKEERRTGEEPGQEKDGCAAGEKTEEHTQEGEMTAEQGANERAGEPVQSPELENPEVLRYLQETETLTEDPERLWKELRKQYPKIQPFDYEDGCEILTIRPQDIGRLPRESWIYGNNSFLLHGYYNFRYIILVRLGGEKMRARYLIGVPGHYYSNEKYMASMFGFPNFVLSKNSRPMTAVLDTGIRISSFTEP